MLTLNDGRSELWQWDTGRTLDVDADCSQVHFSNKVFGRSIDVDVVDGVAIIPDILLQTDKDLNVWAFVGTAENGYTKISKTFKVSRRNKPADYVFTPADQMTLQTIQNHIGDLADLTTEAKNNLVAAINEAAQSGGGGSTVELDTTLTQSGKAADAAAVGDRLSALSEEKVNKSGWAADKYLGTDNSGNVVEKEAPNGDSAGLPENLAYLQDVTVDEASGDFIPMLSPNGTEYRLSIGDDGVPVIKNVNGATVWSGTSGGSSGGDTGGDDTGGGGTGTTWNSGVPYTLTIIADEYVNKTNGAFEVYTGWSRTDYTPCAGAARITVTGVTYSGNYNAFYDVNKAFISAFGLDSNITSEITVPDNAAFFIISSSSTSVANTVVTPYET